ncbi:hypothetical protein KA021_02620 [Candidatus Saccharibacteria bacterium]|jgi:hypothetical protein|nr:hypothetical protein [Candidatus Saccharibacteria bacterium]
MISAIISISRHVAISTIDLGLPYISLGENKVQAGLQFFLGVAIALAVLFIAIGGFKYTTSGGEPASLKQAKETITYAVIGLIVAVLAQIIIGLVVSAI